MIRLYKQSIISFKEGAEPEMCNTKQSLSDGYLVKVAFDEQLKAIYQFLHNQAKQCKIQYNNLLSSIIIDTQLNLHYSLFTMNAVYFLLQKDNIIHGLMVVGEPTLTSVATIEHFYCDEEHVHEFLDVVTQILSDVSISDLIKLRLNIPKDTSTDKLDLLIREGEFKKIATLEKEIMDRDIIIYDKLI